MNSFKIVSLLLLQFIQTGLIVSTPPTPPSIPEPMGPSYFPSTGGVAMTTFGAGSFPSMGPREIEGTTPMSRPQNFPAGVPYAGNRHPYPPSPMPPQPHASMPYPMQPPEPMPYPMQPPIPRGNTNGGWQGKHHGGRGRGGHERSEEREDREEREGGERRERRGRGGRNSNFNNGYGYGYGYGGGSMQGYPEYVSVQMRPQMGVSGGFPGARSTLPPAMYPPQMYPQMQRGFQGRGMPQQMPGPMNQRPRVIIVPVFMVQPAAGGKGVGGGAGGGVPGPGSKGGYPSINPPNEVAINGGTTGMNNGPPPQEPQPTPLPPSPEAIPEVSGAPEAGSMKGVGAKPPTVSAPFRSKM